MRHLLTILAALLLCAAPAQAQIVKTVSYNISNNTIVPPTIQAPFDFGSRGIRANTAEFGTQSSSVGFSTNGKLTFYSTNSGFAFGAGASAAQLRNDLSLGATNDVEFNELRLGGSGSMHIRGAAGNISFYNSIEAENVLLIPADADPVEINSQWNDPSIRSNLGMGSNSIVTFGGITNNGDITIANTTATNGLLFIRRTNNEAFLGLANLLASNNTTLSNETLFRVGRAEQTNQSAQFGFRVVRTNNGGEGLATFSVFGYNALMMIGPSDRSRTNTATNAAIEADIWTMNQTNRVMTLRDTNTGALTLHQDLGFGAGLTNTTPSNTNTPAVWMRVWVGTNNYRLPLYQ